MFFYFVFLFLFECGENDSDSDGDVVAVLAQASLASAVEHTLAISLSHDKLVKRMPEFVAWVNPRRVLTFFKVRCRQTELIGAEEGYKVFACLVSVRHAPRPSYLVPVGGVGVVEAGSDATRCICVSTHH